MAAGAVSRGQARSRDGSSLDDDPVLAARTAAEAVRALNHATIGGHGYTHAADVDAVTGELELLAARLGQALGQASQWLTRQHARAAITHGHGAASIKPPSR